jgi:hypothetical protein
MAGTGTVSGVWGMNGTVTPYSASLSRSAGTVGITIGEDNCCGGGRYGNGRFREIAIYNRALSDSERSIVEGFLRSKWGTG